MKRTIKAKVKMQMPAAAFGRAWRYWWGGMWRIQNQDAARDDEEREAFSGRRNLNSRWISIGSWK